MLRVKVMELPENGEADRLCRRLLELNATDLLHGSYGIQGNEVVLTEALELSHLDYEEFLASLADPTNEDHESNLQWVGGSFHPCAFDLHEVNEKLAEIKL